jgi:hypothetical protein
MKKLNQISKENPFKTPEGYFEQVEKSVQEKISSGKVNEKNALWQPVFTTLMLLFIVSGYFFYQNHYSYKTEQLSYEDWVTYYENTYLFEDDDSDLYTLLEITENNEQKNDIYEYIIEDEWIDESDIYY